MTKKILIVGAGFAGTWAALGARRLIELHKDRVGDGIEVTVVAPEPKLAMRPRLYEANPATLFAPLDELFLAIDVKFVRGIVDTIRTADKEVEVVNGTGSRSTLQYDRLVLAAGSHLFRPNVPGLREHTFSIDQIDEATHFEAHLRQLTKLPDSPSRNTVVVCGGGFTGIELAAELPQRLRAILGIYTQARVVVIERGNEIGSGLGPNPRPSILKAFEDLGVETRLGVAVASIDASGVVTTAGERIESLSVVWTAGLESTPLTQQIPGDKDSLGRLQVDRDLRAMSCSHVFAAGDAAFAATDDKGNHALMSCQHALNLGRSAGHNAAADLLGVDTHPYSQVCYRTCLDLGGWGAVITDGWDRQVFRTGGTGKEIKHYINNNAIYPPPPDPVVALAAGDPKDDSFTFKSVAEKQAAAVN